MNSPAVTFNRLDAYDIAGAHGWATAALDSMLARVQADKIELELAEKRGLLLPADQIEPKLRAAMVAAREMWRNEPARLAREVPGKTIKEMEDLLALSYEAFLIKLSRWQDVQIVEDEEGDG